MYEPVLKSRKEMRSDGDRERFVLSLGKKERRMYGKREDKRMKKNARCTGRYLT